VVVQIDTAGTLEKRLERYRTAIAASPPPEVHTRRAGVDRFLGRIISKCLAVDPKDRYANVQQILQDLHRRDQNRARRPLTLLGIVGPLLILIATCVFGARSIHRASTSTKVALRAEALESNKLAAAFAARTLENEIQRYFQASRDEASRPEFVEQLRVALETPEVDSALQEIASLGAPALTHGKTEVRERLLDVPARLQLEAVLNERLKRYPVNNKQSRRPRLASMFVTDNKGTILSIAFEQEVERDENSAGRNFCYRTYFHGGREDLPQAETKIGDVKPLTTTRLSAAFPSTATRLWKVAVSTPVYLTDDRQEPDAIFVVTINLGDFELPQSEQTANKIAVLVEAREGPEQGTILQHPLMDSRRSDDVKLEGERYQMPPEMLQRLLKGGDVNYVDPLASAPDGQPYVGPWIAAMQPISVPKVDNDEDLATSPEQDRADLLILVQYRLETVFEPVNQMQRDLLWEGAAAIASILLVTLALWFFVRKVGNPITEQTPSSAGSKPSSLGTTETIAV
jgi:eukaryotic-like serine/threonine-protein kinase